MPYGFHGTFVTIWKDNHKLRKLGVKWMCSYKRESKKEGKPSKRSARTAFQAIDKWVLSQNSWDNCGFMFSLGSSSKKLSTNSWRVLNLHLLAVSSSRCQKYMKEQPELGHCHHQIGGWPRSSHLGRIHVIIDSRTWIQIWKAPLDFSPHSACGPWSQGAPRGEGASEVMPEGSV